MSVVAGLPAKAPVSDGGEHGVTEKGSAAPQLGLLFLLFLITAVWLGALIYGTVQAVGYVGELM